MRRKPLDLPVSVMEMDDREKAKRYWAYISYAHEDERWAAWLQKALESYRIPKRLVAAAPSAGEIPRRLNPVFRDRADLSSASDLTEQVQSTLESSRALIVICSPAAARSRWVNEEISRFRALRGERQIHCLIVGDPESSVPDENCFPPALLEGGNEPLAADARKSADGRQLAKLKLIAGILGLRLDELRRRDQQRRNRWMAGALGTAFAVALFMAVMAVIAVKARNEAERSHAETLANYEFLLGDLRSKLVEVGRLDILEDVGSFISERGQSRGLDELSEAQQTQVALAWRQIGIVHQQRSEFEEAMDVFQRSLRIFEALQSDHPDNRDYLFEWSQALFYVGFIHYERGEYPQALDYLGRYHDISERLYQSDPANTAYVMEMAYAHANLYDVYNQMTGTDPQQLVLHASEGVRYNELALELEPENQFYLTMLSETTADLADALLGVCDLGCAYRARLKTDDILEKMLEKNPRNAQLRQRVANALSGLGHIEAAAGNVEQALAHYDESRRVFEDLLAQEPTNTEYQWYHIWKWSYSAELLSDLDRQDEAWEQFGRIHRAADRLMSDPVEVGIEDRIYYGRFLAEYAELAHRRGETAMADLLIGQGLDLLVREAGDNPDSSMARRELTRGLISAWVVGFEPDRPQIHSLALDLVGENPEALSCGEASLAARQAVMAGDREKAGAFTSYLRNKGYWHPGLIRFCRVHEGCGEYAPGL